MSDFELVSGLIDASIYVFGIVGGITLFLLGRRRGDTVSGGVMRGLGVVLFLLFGLAAVPAVVRAVGDVSISASPTTTTTQPPSTTTTTQPCPTELSVTECRQWQQTGELPTRLTSRWVEPTAAAIENWTDSALDYIESLETMTTQPCPTRLTPFECAIWLLRLDDPAPDPASLSSLAKHTCEGLNRSDDPANEEAEFRAAVGIEVWQSWGAVLFDDLVNGLCVRR